MYQPRTERLSDKERLDWLQLARTDTVGPITFHRLISRFKTAAKAMEALPTLSRTPPTLFDRKRAERELDQVIKKGGRIIAAGEPEYPLALAAIDDAPPLLTVFGRIDLMHRPCVAIVGSRNASINGRKFTERLARELNEAGYVITSGLARGIDASAHTGSLAKGTIGVVAGGADVIYPPENKSLHEKMMQDGAVISEQPLTMQPLSRHFPKRNRIITGLSLGVVVVEATLKSGSLISARTAAEQGRDVFAVPGFPGDPRAEGPNSLLKDGAVLVQSTSDIIDHLTSFVHRRPDLSKTVTGGLFEDEPEQPETAEEIPYIAPEKRSEALLSLLSFNPVAVDEIVRSCQWTIGTVQSTLLELELSGKVKRLPGNRISLLENEI